jgi:pyruvate ferredoxin oxidoreductase gamma subunit
MIEIRFHGRGGQGAVTAAELVAQAVISEGKYAQAFPNFGPERRGAPVTAFLRVSEDPIYLREKIENPEVVVVLDATLIGLVNVSEGLKQGGLLVINISESRRSTLEKYRESFHVAIVDASRIALETIGLPITNTAIIGSLLKAKDLTQVESMNDPMERRFGKLASKNLDALKKAYDETEILDAVHSGTGTQEQLEDGPVCSYTDFLKSEAILNWEDLQLGCDIDRPGSSEEFNTGNWRTGGKPIIDRDKCINCGFCRIFCPDNAYRPAGEDSFEWEQRYCKGCGICAEECPKGAIEMREEL